MQDDRNTEGKTDGDQKQSGRQGERIKTQATAAHQTFESHILGYEHGDFIQCARQTGG